MALGWRKYDLLVERQVRGLDEDGVEKVRKNVQEGLGGGEGREEEEEEEEEGEEGEGLH